MSRCDPFNPNDAKRGSGIGTYHERVRCHMPLRRSMLTGHVAGP